VVLADRRLCPIPRNVRAKQEGRNDRRKKRRTEGAGRSRSGGGTAQLEGGASTSPTP
jgi:hypothetical protein